jgi:CHAD domain-containing protein
LHALRIAVKRLRYTAEVFSPLYEKSLDETISVCRKMQNALGTMHDFYVWQQTLPGPATTGSRSLKKVFKEERRQAYEKFRKQWDKVQKRGVWEDMLKAVGP